MTDTDNPGSDGVRGIDHDPVSAWLIENIEGVAGPFSFSPIAGGHSNLTYLVTDGASRRLVLRRPPLGPLLASAHDMGREHRIISAVGATDVPVPAALGLCTDVEVNDAPFYVMDFVDGDVVTDAETAVDTVVEADREPLAMSLIENLGRLHLVDPDEIGLGELGKKAEYIPRQLRRWSGQWEKSKTRELPSMDRIRVYLEENIPEQHGATIVHGDYRLGNCISADGRIAAVLDWELCTLGDPLADLGYLMNSWSAAGETDVVMRGVTATSTLPGFPERDQLLDRYAAITGRDVGVVEYYRAFSYWRLAAIIEGVLARYLGGQMAEAGDTDAFRLQVEGLADSAEEAIARLESS